MRTMMNRLMLMVALVLYGTGATGQRLKTADLLFHVTAKPNAITEVTPDMIDHVAIVINKDSVIEAVRQGVKTTPTDSLRQQEGYFLVGRVRGVARHRSVAEARRYLGRSYDFVYLPDNADIYCSELVQLSFVNKKGDRLFLPVPMSFHDAYGRITTYWTDFYRRRGMDVPEGLPGTNPAELSKRHNVRIIGRLH